jgi:hypothetical protein
VFGLHRFKLHRHLVDGTLKLSGLGRFSVFSGSSEPMLDHLCYDDCGPSSVIKIVKMKYNRNDIKW